MTSYSGRMKFTPETLHCALLALGPYARANVHVFETSSEGVIARADIFFRGFFRKGCASAKRDRTVLKKFITQKMQTYLREKPIDDDTENIFRYIVWPTFMQDPYTLRKMHDELLRAFFFLNINKTPEERKDLNLFASAETLSKKLLLQLNFEKEEPVVQSYVEWEAKVEKWMEAIQGLKYRTESETLVDKYPVDQVRRNIISYLKW